MKKLWIIALSATLFACGGNENKNEHTTNPPQSMVEEQPAEETPATETATETEEAAAAAET